MSANKYSKNLVKIVWIDSHSPDQAGWIDVDEIDTGEHVVISVGFVINDGKEWITIASQIAGENSNEVGGVITIPKVCIRSMCALRNGKKHANRGHGYAYATD